MVAVDFLDSVAPLVSGSHRDAVAYTVVEGQLRVELADGSEAALAGPATLAGYRSEAASPSSVVLRHHGLHMELVIDREHPVGRTDAAGVADVILEAAVTTIMDGEDSVAAIDGVDKVLVYRNWLGLMKGELEDTFTKAGRTMTRRPADDRSLTAPDGSPFRLRGRVLLLTRNVGHLMTIDAVLDRNGDEVPEGLLDAMVTVLVGCHDRRRPVAERNSRAGSIYIVKPKMQGSEEAAFAAEVFDQVEEILGLPPHTVKVGLMDEERRTSVNLRQCIHALRSRLVFINTGFLDRTGDEIHTSMEAGVDGAQGGHAAAAMAPDLRGPERGHRAGAAACGTGPDREGHVGGAGPDGADARGEGRHSRSPARPAPGCRRPRRPPCTRPTITGWTCRSARRIWPRARRRRWTTCSASR